MHTKLVTAAFALTLAISGTAYAQVPKGAAKADGYNEATAAKSELIIDWQQANGDCRGTPGGKLDSPACKRREVISNELEKLNYCYGKTGQVGADYVWHPCVNGSIHVDGTIGSKGNTITQPTLKQEKEEEARAVTESMKLVGFCASYFDINTKAAEALEVGGSVSREEARRFLTSLPHELETFGSAIGQMFLGHKLAGLGSPLPLNQDQIIKLIEQGGKEGEQAGNRDTEQSVVYQNYKKCLVFAPDRTANRQPSPTPPTRPVLSNAPNLAAVVTASEIEGVRSQIRKCWVTGKSEKNQIVTLAVTMNKDGTPAKAEIQNKDRYNNDPEFRAVADAAHLAIMNPRCHPWPLSPEKYESWKTITFNFDPRDY